MKTILLSALLLTGTSAIAQSPEIDSWIHNTTGTNASYYDTGGSLNTMTEEAYCQEVCYSPDSVWIHSSGLYEEMDAWTNPGTPQDQSHEFRIPRNPVEETGVKTEVAEVNAVAFLVNGVPIFGLSDGTSYDASSNSTSPMGDGIWYGEAFYTEGHTLNDMGGHPNPGAFAMHSHALATPLWSSTPTSQHSPIIGYSFDGFPIYGPYGYANPMDDSSPVVRMESSYDLRTMSDRSTLPDGSPSIPAGPSDFSTFPIGYFIQDYEYVSGLGDLDEYNGRFCVTPEYPSGIYAYFTTMDATGGAQFPYYLGIEYYGVVDQANVSGSFQWPTVCEVTGVSEIAQIEADVYPNPGSGLYSISSSETIEKAEVYSISGALMSCQSFPTQLNMADLANGTYIVKLFSNKGMISQMVVKQ